MEDECKAPFAKQQPIDVCFRDNCAIGLRAEQQTNVENLSAIKCKTMHTSLRNLRLLIATFSVRHDTIPAANPNPSDSGGRIFGIRIQSNDYFEVIGVTDYHSQKVIVTKYRIHSSD